MGWKNGLEAPMGKGDPREPSEAEKWRFAKDRISGISLSSDMARDFEAIESARTGSVNYGAPKTTNAEAMIAFAEEQARLDEGAARLLETQKAEQQPKGAWFDEDHLAFLEAEAVTWRAFLTKHGSEQKGNPSS